MAVWQALMFTIGGGLLPGDASFYLFVLGSFGWISATGRRLAREVTSRRQGTA